ncbi:MAG: DNA polymerase Y family protein [Actinobacteria bacterium]|nr:DNA polymerase Y family protein [Actinomycetota bacterium]
MSAVEATRTLVLHCPHWSVVAAGVAHEPAIVVRANRVVAASAAARAAGISVGLRRRESQRRCPHVLVVDHDPGRDARAFEPVASSLDAVAPRVEVTRPGTLAIATRGPSRYFGGDRAVAERTAQMAVGAAGGGVEVCVGVADGAFAALLAAHRVHHRVEAAHPAGTGSGAGAQEPVLVVPPGATPSFLAPHPVDVLLDVLDEPDLVDVWRRLGLRTLGRVAELPAADVLARFGTPGATAHRLASGLDPRPLDARRPAPELAVSLELDPPADRVDRAAFAAKALADRLHARLGADGLACTHVLVEAETEHGETLARHWRHEGALGAGALADRVRWQLDGWLTGSAGLRPTAGIAHLTLVPVEVVAARGRQLGFWGGETLVDERILRAVARVQGTAGLDAVAVPELRGGRGPADRVVRVSAATVDLTSPRPAARPTSVAEPWPGQIPAPAPATVLEDPEPVDVVDAGGRPVGVTGRAEVTAAPARLARAGRAPEAITGWAGPWPADEHWWDPTRHRRRARFQVLDASGTAHLLAVEAGRWWLEATYD